MIEVVYEGEEGVEATFSPFVSPCYVAGMARGVGAYLWGEVTGNNLIFFSFGEEEEIASLDDVFVGEMVSGSTPFVFV